MVSFRAAVRRFIEDHSVIPSSQAVAGAVAAAEQAADYNALFLAPITAQVFDLDSALSWLLFLSAWRAAPGAPKKDALPGALDCGQALAELQRIFDTALEDTVYDYFEDSE